MSVCTYLIACCQCANLDTSPDFTLPWTTAIDQNLRPLIRLFSRNYFCHARNACFTHGISTARPTVFRIRAGLDGVLERLHEIRNLCNRRGIAEGRCKLWAVLVQLPNHRRNVNDTAGGCRFEQREDRLGHFQRAVIVALQRLLDH